MNINQNNDNAKNEEKIVKKPTFASKLGTVVGMTISACLCAIVVSTVIALTVKIIVALISWLF